jgi:hypothetical protein
MIRKILQGMKWLKTWIGVQIEILELNGRLRRLDDVYCEILSRHHCYCNEKVRQTKLKDIGEAMASIQITIDALRSKLRNKTKIR